MNLIENCNSEDGLAGWAPSGKSTLSVHDDPAPDTLPSLSDDPAERERKPSGRYVLAAHRADEKDGLCREISCAPRPKITYRVAGWVGLGPGADGCHAVRVVVCTDDDDRPVGGGVVVAEAGKWGEIKGSFRVDEQPRCAKVYVHGPPAGVDLKVMDLQVFGVNKIARLRHLRKKTDKV